jgi:hypothetical protein
MPRSSKALRKPVPGRLFAWVKVISWIELAVFAALLFFWLAPGFEGETSIFGLAHGLGFVALCLLIWACVLRREAPYTLLAATLTPVGPVGSVVAIELIERRGCGIAEPEDTSTDSGLTRTVPASVESPPIEGSSQIPRVGRITSSS